MEESRDPARADNGSKRGMQRRKMKMIQMGVIRTAMRMDLLYEHYMYGLVILVPP